MPTPLQARCSGFWEKRLCWISPASAGIAQRSLTSSPACPTPINHTQGQTCQFPLFGRLFSSLFFFFFRSPKADRKIDSIRTAGCKRRGAAVQRSHSRKEETGKKKKKRLSSKSLELFANNNTAFTEQPKIRWHKCAGAAAEPPGLFVLPPTSGHAHGLILPRWGHTETISGSARVCCIEAPSEGCGGS